MVIRYLEGNSVVCRDNQIPDCPELWGARSRCAKVRRVYDRKTDIGGVSPYMSRGGGLKIDRGTVSTLKPQGRGRWVITRSLVVPFLRVKTRGSPVGKTRHQRG